MAPLYRVMSEGYATQTELSAWSFKDVIDALDYLDLLADVKQIHSDEQSEG